MTQQGNALMQLVAYGIQNSLYNSGLNYALDLAEIEIVLKENNEQNQFKYECEIGKISDQFKIQGVIIDLDSQVEYSNPIENELHKMTLEIYVHDVDENKNKLEDKINWIGSIPLIFGKISNVSNSVVIKLPNVFFPSESKYFNGFADYKLVIKSLIKFKKIFLENIIRYDDTVERRNIAALSSIFYEHDWKHIVSSPVDFEVKKDYVFNKIMYEKKLSNTKEKVLGVYFVIPEELIEFISYIELKLKTYNKIIDLDALETIYKIEEKGYVNLYGICIQQPLDLEPTDLVKIEFNYGEGNDNDLISTQINNICIYPFVSNKLICVNYNLRLKFVDGELNETFNENEIMMINKFSNNVDELSDAMCEFQKNKSKEYIKLNPDIEKKNDNTQFIMRFLG
jgi:hypothetical protein